MKTDDDTGKRLLESITRPVVELMDSSHCALADLVKDLNKQRRAKVTKAYKLKGAVAPGNLPKKTKIIATSGVIEKDRQGEWYGDGDTLIGVDEIAWDVRQRATIEGFKLHGAYPAEKVDHSFTGPVELRATALDEINQRIEMIRQAVENYGPDKH